MKKESSYPFNSLGNCWRGSCGPLLPEKVISWEDEWRSCRCQGLGLRRSSASAGGGGAAAASRAGSIKAGGATAAVRAEFGFGWRNGYSDSGGGLRLRLWRRRQRFGWRPQQQRRGSGARSDQLITDGAQLTDADAEGMNSATQQWPFDLCAHN